MEFDNLTDEQKARVRACKTAETESHGRFVSSGKTHDIARQTHYPNGVRVHV